MPAVDRDTWKDIARVFDVVNLVDGIFWIVACAVGLLVSRLHH